MYNSPSTSRNISSWDGALSLAAFLAGSATLIFMTVFSTFNVLVMRKALNSPIRGAEDLMVLALVTVVAIAIPFGARTGAHIEIELLEPYMKQRFANISLAVMKLIAIGLVATLSWQLWLAGGQASRFGQASQQLVISFGPFYRILAVSTAIYTVILVTDLAALLFGRSILRLSVSSVDGS